MTAEMRVGKLVDFWAAMTDVKLAGNWANTMAENLVGLMDDLKAGKSGGQMAGGKEKN